MMPDLPMDTCYVDGTNDYGQRDTPLANVTNGVLVTNSVWFKRDVAAVNTQVNFIRHTVAGTSDRAGFGFTNQRRIFMMYRNTGGGVEAWWQSAILPAEDISGKWEHLMLVADMTQGAVVCRAWLGGTEVGMTNLQGNGGICHFTAAPIGLAGKPGGAGAYMAGGLGDLWVDYGLYLPDPTKFRNPANGCPVDVGPTGNLVTGTTPSVYASGDETPANGWWKNLGLGGPFNKVGDFSAEATSPSDGCPGVEPGAPPAAGCMVCL